MNRRTIACCLLVVGLAGRLAAAPGLDEATEAALRAAVDRIAPHVVRIEAIGGLDRVGGQSVGAGPTTGLIVDPAGYVVSSSFNLVGRPSSILVRLADGTRKPATLVATDTSRMLVLLKIEPVAALPPLVVVPTAEMRVGQWAIAVGRAFDAKEPNRSVGVLAALNRVWGKAIQTDAAVSPNNYGGPLVDIRGRVLGLLVPLDPSSGSEVAGVEWYDSGIGFAIPAEQILSVLPRWRTGENLRTGYMGISYGKGTTTLQPPVLATVRPRSPAAAAGLAVGDRIAEVDGRGVGRIGEVREALGRRYAGDEVSVVVVRGNDRLEKRLRLVADLPPFEHAWIGVLPSRGGEGLVVRAIEPESPASRSGLRAGDRIAAIDGAAIADRSAAVAALATKAPADAVRLSIARGAATLEVALTLGTLPATLLGELPEERLPAPPAAKADPPEQAGLREVHVGGKPVWCYVAEGRGGPPALAVWLAPPGKGKSALEAWGPLCRRYGVVAAAAEPQGGRWQALDVIALAALIETLKNRFDVDDARVVLCGERDAADVAARLTARQPGAAAGLAVANARLASLPEPAGDHRLSILVVSTDAAGPDPRLLERLRRAKHPLETFGGGGGDFPAADHLDPLLRWIDGLDRL